MPVAAAHDGTLQMAKMHTPTNAPLFGWGTPVEVERRTRIRLCVAAHAYEVMAQPVMGDAEFDALARSSRPDVTTGLHDDWWREHFVPHTGQWIHTHPDVEGIRRLACSVVDRRQTGIAQRRAAGR